jgi:hypothetical protein
MNDFFRKQLKIDRIISIATLLSSVVAIALVLKKPTPVAPKQAPAEIAAHAQSFDQKMADFEQAVSQSQSAPAPASSEGSANLSSPAQPAQSASVDSSSAMAAASASAPKAEVHLKSDEISAVLAQTLGAAGPLTPDSNIGNSAPPIKDQQVSFDGDVVHGQFLTEIAGKDVWVTISGHLGDKDGYATFDPTEFKVGDLNVPVSLVNPALQKKLSEERDRLKLPDNVGSMKVQNGELVMQQK